MDHLELNQKAEHILYILKFLNYAYNQPDSEHDLPMDNDEKTGGQHIFFYVMDELTKLDSDIRILLKNR